MTNMYPKSPFSFLLFFTVLFTVSFHQIPANFDHYTFALQWPPTFCYSYGSHLCNQPIEAEFKIHGLWPSDNRGFPFHPENCNSADIFNYQNVAHLEPELSKAWPDLIYRSPGNEYYFWSEEWRKHGTCSGLTQAEYFKKALDLYHLIDPSRVTSQLHFFVGTYFLAGDLRYQWGNAYGYYPKISCYYTYGQYIQRLHEMQFNVSIVPGPNGNLLPQSIISTVLNHCWNYNIFFPA